MHLGDWKDNHGAGRASASTGQQRTHVCQKTQGNGVHGQPGRGARADTRAVGQLEEIGEQGGSSAHR